MLLQRMQNKKKRNNYYFIENMRTLFKENIKRYIKQAWLWMLRNDVFVFLLFMAIATLFWWGRTMSSPREVTITLPITYTDISKNIVFEKDLPASLDITIRDNGKVLRQISHTTPSITINVADKLKEDKGKMLITAEVLRPKIQDILPGSTIIQHIKPEVIESAYVRQEKKLIPIKLRANWTLDDQYQLSKAPTINPTHVEIFGTYNEIATIDSILTDSITLHNIKDSICKNISLLVPKGIRVIPTSTMLTLVPEQFTDKSFTLPIHVDNLPEDETIHLFPQELTITVRVGMSHFSQVQSQDFHATCPYPTSEQQTLPVSIIHNNPHVTLLRTNTREVEYIIER